MSVQETIEILESRGRTEREKIRKNVRLAFTLADAIGNRVAFVFKDPKERSEEDLLQPWHIYPDLFEADRIKAQEDSEARLLAQQKASLMNAAALNNARRRNNG